MTTHKSVVLTALVLGIALNGLAVADQGELARTLESAELSSEAKALVRDKALEAVRLGLSEGDVAELIRRGVRRGLQAGDLAPLLEVVAEVKRQDLPVGPVLDKVKEGLAKRVPPERIVTAASRISRELATARDLIRQAEREGVRVEKEPCPFSMRGSRSRPISSRWVFPPKAPRRRSRRRSPRVWAGMTSSDSARALPAS